MLTLATYCYDLSVSADVNLLRYLFEVVAEATYLLNFTLDCLRVWRQYGLFQGCEAVVKMTQLQLWSPSFH